MPQKINISEIMGTTVFFAGMTVMAGWFFDIAILKSIHPSWVTMKFTTALSFCLSGAILYCLAMSLGRESSLAYFCLPGATLSILLLMATLLFSSIFGIKTGIEDLFVKESEEAVETVVPGRPSVGTMLNFSLLALAGLLSMFRPRNLKTWFRSIGWGIFGIGGLAVLGYLLNYPIFYYALEGWSTAMAVHTALLFIMLGTGLVWIKKKESRKSRFVSIKLKFIIVFLTISLIPLAFIASLTFLNSQNSLKQSSLESLTAIAEFKEGEVFLYLQKLETRVLDFASDALLIKALDQINTPNREKAFSPEEIYAHLTRKKLLDEDLLTLDLLDLNGKVVASSDPQRRGLDLSGGDYFKKKQRGVYIKSSHIEIDHDLEIDLSAPVESQDQKPEAHGFLLAHFDASLLNKLMSGGMVLELGALSQIRGLGKTGETYLVEQSGMMITDSLFFKDAVFKKKVDTWPVKKCLEENKEVRGNWRGYRGVPVIGASMCMSIGDFKWILISEQDRSEALGKVADLKKVSCLIGFTSLLFVLFVAFATARLISDPIRSLQKGTEIIGKGDLDHKITIETPDEIGQLSRAFAQMVERLKTTLGRLGSVMEVAPLGIKISSTSVDGGILALNSTLLKIYGYDSKEEFLSLPPSAHYADPRDREKFLELSAKGGAGNFEVLLKRKDGSLFHASLNSTIAVIEGGGQVIVTVEDITERKLAEANLRKLSRAVEQSPISIVITDTSGAIEYVNPKFTEITGYSYEEAIGQNPRILKSGHTSPEEYKRLWDIINSGGEWSGEFCNKKKNGELYWEAASISGIKDSDGTITHFLAIKEDITARKKIENQLKEFTSKLEASNRDLEDFAFIASHDLQEPLRKVITFGSLLKEEYGENLKEEGKDYLEIMQRAATRMRALIENLLKISRLSTRANPFEETDINKILQHILADLEVSISQSGAGISVGPLPVLDAEKTQMRQLFQNLLSNALKFKKEGEPPMINIESRPWENGMCEITVKDNGIGFDEKYLDRIFRPFQRLHGRDKFEGSGMGLAICKKIVERHGGNITAQSAPGKGTAFIIRLPLHHYNDSIKPKKT